MYNNVYQEYIDSIIGTMPRNQMDFQNEQFMNINSYNNFSNNMNSDLEQLYPDLYRLLYPMVQAACMRNTKPINKDTLDEMVNDIYTNFNADDITVLNINLTNDVRSSKSNDAKTEKSSVSRVTSKAQTETRNIEQGESRVTRRPNNYVLNDLIRILLIRELLGRPGSFPPNRPGFPSQRPGRPGDGRPPFRPRDIQSFDYNIYEEPINMYSSYNNQYLF